MSTLIKNINLLVPDGRIVSGQDVFLQNGVIMDIGVNLPQHARETIDGTGKFLSPSLPVTHAHSPMHILRGLAEDVGIEDWFNKEIFPFESKLTPEDVYWGSRLCFAELLENGVTAVADHYFFCEAIIAAARDAGIRLDLAVCTFDFNFEEMVSLTKQLVAQYRDDPLIRVRYGPHSTYLLSPDHLKQIVEMAKADGSSIHLHCSESKAEEDNSQAKYGKSHAQIIQQAGGFTLPCLLAHGLYLSEYDLKLLGKDTWVSSAMKTYMKLGMGEGTIFINHDKIHHSFGIDGGASSNTANVLEQARLFALAGKWHNKAAQFTLADLWKTLQNGHQAMFFNTGKLEKGAPADLIIWDLNQANTLPLYHPLAAILYSSDSRNIETVFVNGKILKKDGILLQDTAELQAQVLSRSNALLKRGKGEANVTF